ncbi:MAG: hypoxanthine phosphoribosyltransferase [Deltaproteobacteria bacterium]
MQTQLRQLIPENEIHSIVRRLSAEIRAENPSSEAVLIGVMKGAFVFMADLARELGPAFEVDFMQAASYGHRDTPSEEVRIISDISVDIRGRDVIVVEGIIDRGNTAKAVINHLEKKGPSSIRLCTLILRKGHSHNLTVDYIGRQIDDGFIVGYGMDYREKYRGLKGLFTIDKT